MAQNINRVVMTGNLTTDPELRSLPSGENVCKLRLAVEGLEGSGQGSDPAHLQPWWEGLYGS